MAEHSETPDHQLAYFFVPLPEPLSLPDKLIVPFRNYPSDLDADFSLRTFTDDGLTVFTRVSLVVHQRPTKAALPGFSEAFDAAVAAFPLVSREGGSTMPAPQLDARCTVIEAMVVLDPGETEDPFTEAFDEAIEHIRLLQRRYYLTTQHAVTLVNRLVLPFGLPMALRNVFDGEAEPTWPSTFQFFLVNDQMPPSLTPANEEGSVALDALFADLPENGGPFQAMADLRREALLAWRNRNTMVGAVLFGAYTELLFREVHLLLIWDEGSDAETAAEATKHHRSITSIVNSEFHIRLGGKWAAKGTEGPVADWSRHVRDLRNRVVHSGYAPTPDELRDAAEASAQLEAFVGDRLATRIDRYPTAGFMFLGHEGLKKHKALARFEAATSATYIPTDIPTTFSAWRFEAERHRNGGPFTGSLDNAQLVLVRYLNAQHRWWLVDEEAQLACLAENFQPGPIEQGLLDDINSGSVEVGGEISVAVMKEINPLPQEKNPRWYARMLVIPPGAIGRFATSRIPPGR